MKAPQHSHDPWELDDDTPPPWRLTIEDRARLLGHKVSANARWAIFALQALLDEVRAIPQSSFIRYIALYGPLANGVESEAISLCAILIGTTPAPIYAELGAQLTDLLSGAQRTYALKIDCLMVMEHDIARPDRRPPEFTAIEHDHVVVWP